MPSTLTDQEFEEGGGKVEETPRRPSGAGAPQGSDNWPDTAESVLQYLLLVHADPTADVIGEMYDLAERIGIRTAECRECERTIVFGSRAVMREMCHGCQPDG